MRVGGWLPRNRSSLFRHGGVDILVCRKSCDASGRQECLPHRGEKWVLQDGLLPKEVVQQLTRSQAADGTEELFGWIRLPFAPGQRTGCIHVAFCPPLCVTPEVTVEQIEGPDARIKTAQLLPYGARFDLKLAATAEASTAVVLQFLARTPRKG